MFAIIARILEHNLSFASSARPVRPVNTVMIQAVIVMISARTEALPSTLVQVIFVPVILSSLIAVVCHVSCPAGIGTSTLLKETVR